MPEVEHRECQLPHDKQEIKVEREYHKLYHIENLWIYRVFHINFFQKKNPINSKFLHVIHINNWISVRIKP